jgi:GNAT superfamily N-acetyltransferase
MMQPKELAMPVEAFRRMPRQPGWKHEYWDGKARLRPSERVVTVRLDLPLALGERPGGWVPCEARATSEADRDALVEGFLGAFEGSAEFCGWSPERFRERADENIDDFFAGKKGVPLAASRVAADAEGTLVAAALVRESRPVPLLHLLFVRPDWQRLGVASALVREAADALAGQGREALRSHYFWANRSSRAWYEAFGFVEEPDLVLARTRLRNARHERWRLEETDQLTETRRATLDETVVRLEQNVERLEAKAEEEGFVSVAPILQERDSE